jgi:hypothetical protein
VEKHNKVQYAIIANAHQITVYLTMNKKIEVL